MSESDLKKISPALATARRAMRAEGLAILRAANRMGDVLDQAAAVLLSCRGKVVVTGLGKSGLVARKIAATLCATGQPAVYLHPVEALHGDLGVLGPGDVLIVVSCSGATPELVRLLEHLDGAPRSIGIFGTLDSPMTGWMSVVLDGSVEYEADHMGLVPTASAAVAMAMGDALACALMRARGITAADLDWLHPAGRRIRP